MKKQKLRFTLRIWRKDSDEWETTSIPVGTFETSAVSEAKAFSNICYNNGFRNYYGSYNSVEYQYEIIKVENLDGSAYNPNQDNDIDEEDMRTPSPFDDDYKPLKKVENGVPMILADNGEYVEEFD